MKTSLNLFAFHILALVIAWITDRRGGVQTLLPDMQKKKKKILMDASSEFPLVFTIYCSYYTYLSSKLLALIMLFGDAAGERMFGLLPMAHRAFSKLWLLSSHIHTHTPSPLQHYHEMCSTNNRVDLATSAQTDRFAFAIDLIQHLDLSWLSLFK